MSQDLLLSSEAGWELASAVVVRLEAGAGEDGAELGPELRLGPLQHGDCRRGQEAAEAGGLQGEVLGPQQHPHQPLGGRQGGEVAAGERS